MSTISQYYYLFYTYISDGYLSSCVVRTVSSVISFTFTIYSLKLHSQLLPFLVWSISRIRGILILKCMSLKPSCPHGWAQICKKQKSQILFYSHICVRKIKCRAMLSMKPSTNFFKIHGPWLIRFRICGRGLHGPKHHLICFFFHLCWSSEKVFWYLIPPVKASGVVRSLIFQFWFLIS